MKKILQELINGNISVEKAEKMLKTMQIAELEDFANLMKAKPPDPIQIEMTDKEDGVFPLFHCNQEIPCNPCTSVCPQNQIKTVDDIITQLPYFLGDQDCIGCGKCIAVCPGLAVTLVDFRKDKENPVVEIYVAVEG